MLLGNLVMKLISFGPHKLMKIHVKMFIFRDPELSAVCRRSGTLVLYPGAEATDLEEFMLDCPVYPSTIIIIDGTWSQAKDIFYKNSLFRLPKQVNQHFNR